MAGPKVSPTDAELVARLNVGDEQALAILHERYYTEIFRFALGTLKSREAAEEVVQDAFVVAWTRRASLDPTLSIRAYLYGVVRNGMLMARRTERIAARAVEVLVQGTAEVSSSGTDPHKSAEETELTDMVSEAMEQLSERQRLALTFRWLRQMSYEEVATAMGISRQAVDALLQRTYGQLRRALSPLRNEETGQPDSKGRMG